MVFEYYNWTICVRWVWFNSDIHRIHLSCSFFALFLFHFLLHKSFEVCIDFGRNFLDYGVYKVHHREVINKENIAANWEIFQTEVTQSYFGYLHFQSYPFQPDFCYYTQSLDGCLEFCVRCWIDFVQALSLTHYIASRYDAIFMMLSISQSSPECRVESDLSENTHFPPFPSMILLD